MPFGVATEAHGEGHTGGNRNPKETHYESRISAVVVLSNEMYIVHHRLRYVQHVL